jgi:hypothetical protein
MQIDKDTASNADQLGGRVSSPILPAHSSRCAPQGARSDSSSVPPTLPTDRSGPLMRRFNPNKARCADSSPDQDSAAAIGACCRSQLLGALGPLAWRFAIGIAAAALAKATVLVTASHAAPSAPLSAAIRAETASVKTGPTPVETGPTSIKTGPTSITAKATPLAHHPARDAKPTGTLRESPHLLPLLFGQNASQPRRNVALQDFHLLHLVIRQVQTGRQAGRQDLTRAQHGRSAEPSGASQARVESRSPRKPWVP